MANEVFDAVRTVLAVREYQDKPVPRDVLQRILEAGRLSASASNKQPWHFVLVTDREALQDLGRLVKTGPYVAQAPAAIIVGAERDNPLAVSDVSRAIQSMILTAWAEGVGSNWTGFSGLDAVRDKVGLPDSYEVVAVLPLGYPKRKLGKGVKNRKPAEQVYSAERFGSPL
ncbi:MAG TPA: nitroreductase family protein [Candidatus Dormibacteraeota bacterium]